MSESRDSESYYSQNLSGPGARRSQDICNQEDVPDLVNIVMKRESVKLREVTDLLRIPRGARFIHSLTALSTAHLVSPEVKIATILFSLHFT